MKNQLITKLLMVCSDELTPIQAEVFTKVFIKGYRKSEVARELGVNRSTVCRTYDRAFARIKRFAKYM